MSMFTNASIFTNFLAALLKNLEARGSFLDAGNDQKLSFLLLWPKGIQTNSRSQECLEARSIHTYHSYWLAL